jgi:hypothetical protein
MTATLRGSSQLQVEGFGTWDPAGLGAPADGAFPRFPATPFQVLTFKDGHMVSAGLAPIPDPLAPLR